MAGRTAPTSCARSPLPAPAPPPDIAAVTDAATPINVFSHPYFNLGGLTSDNDTILDHLLTVDGWVGDWVLPAGEAGLDGLLSGPCATPRCHPAAPAAPSRPSPAPPPPPPVFLCLKTRGLLHGAVTAERSAPCRDYLIDVDAETGTPSWAARAALACCARWTPVAAAVPAAVRVPTEPRRAALPATPPVPCSRQLAATLVHPPSGRALDILTTAPTLVLYTGAWRCPAAWQPTFYGPSVRGQTQPTRDACPPSLPLGSPHPAFSPCTSAPGRTALQATHSRASLRPSMACARSSGPRWRSRR